MDRTAEQHGGCPVAPGTTEERARRWSTYQPWLQADPIGPWHEIREHGPVVRSEEFGGYWILTRYADLEWAARNADVFSSADIGIPNRQIYKDKLIPIQLDGDEHRTWRQALSALFNPGVVNAITPQIRQAAADAIEPIAARGSCEFVEDFAVRLPAETFLINFGIDRSHLPELLDHKNWLRREGLPNARNDEELHAAGRPLWEFFSAAVDRRRAEGTEGRRDVISSLLRAEHGGRPLTQDEIVNIILMTMFASLDTSNSLLSMVFRHLAEHPEAQRTVVEEPGRIPAIAEELIRHEAMVSTARVVTRDVELHGVKMRAGDRVMMSWGMAGLDPEAFEDADRVDFDRTSVRHLAFGIGPHRCLGMHLARRIVKVALEEWHARIPAYRITPGTSPVARYSPIRGLDRLDLTVGAAGAAGAAR
ncbi:cytochrome P450 [Kitasatospora phosalacinea]|uniref:cytochrome P450 n=1 Tax=Kitasatospora phosalacinea TaxID=2065 RepID=UPI0035D852DB